MLKRSHLKYLNYLNQVDLIQKYYVLSVYQCPRPLEGLIELKPRSQNGVWEEDDFIPFLLFFLLFGQVPYLQKLKSKLLRQGKSEKLVITLSEKALVAFLYFKFLRSWSVSLKTFYTLKSTPAAIDVFFGPVTADFFFFDPTISLIKLSKFVALLKYKIEIPRVLFRHNPRSSYKNCLFFWDLY